MSQRARTLPKHKLNDAICKYHNGPNDPNADNEKYRSGIFTDYSYARSDAHEGV